MNDLNTKSILRNCLDLLGFYIASRRWKTGMLSLTAGKARSEVFPVFSSLTIENPITVTQRAPIGH